MENLQDLAERLAKQALEGYVRLEDVLHTLDMITQPNKTLWQAGFNCALQEIRNSLAKPAEQERVTVQEEAQIPDSLKMFRAHRNFEMAMGVTFEEMLREELKAGKHE